MLCFEKYLGAGYWVYKEYFIFAKTRRVLKHTMYSTGWACNDVSNGCEALSSGHLFYKSLKKGRF